MDHMQMDQVVVGTCVGHYPKIRVAGINPSKSFGKGDTIIFKPKKGSTRKPVQVTIFSLEVDHRQKSRVEPGQLCGVELTCSRKQLPKSGDSVLLVQSKQTTTDKPTSTGYDENDQRIPLIDQGIDCE